MRQCECILVCGCKQKMKESSRCVVEIMALSFRPYFEGRIERLVKNNILPSLELSELEQCRDCIKGKYIKKIKKDAKRSVGILQIIHTDICGPFPVKVWMVMIHS